MDFDVLNPDIYVSGIPHETFRHMRREAPIYWHAEPKGRGFWAVTKYADIVTISRDPMTYSSHRGATFVYDAEEADLTAMQMMMLNMDPPQHVRFRNLVKHGFIPKMIALLEPKIRMRVREVVDRVAMKGTCDFVTDIAQELPLQVIAEMIGVPPEDRRQVFAWSNQMVGFDDPEYQTSKQDGLDAAMQMWGYAGQLAQQRFENPGDDLISMLMKGVAENGLDAMEFASFFMLLVVAGNETTRNAISGGMLALIEHPEERQKLLAHPELLPSAIEEMLRWTTPLIYFRRTATKDTELRGQKIKENDKVVMWYPSANRDEDVFPDPYRFDITRKPNEHLAFGIGQHVCLGGNLARLEMRIMFEEILKRMPDLELAGPMRRLRSNFVNTIKTMPVQFSPERVAMAMP
jgi:cholest-4-en-3-one 26-monooxygenase